MKTFVRCIELSRREVDYLQSAGLLSLAMLECLQNVRWRSETAGTLELSTAMAEAFREAFTEQLAKVGFDKAYEPTAEGRLIEDLIGRFHESHSGA